MIYNVSFQTYISVYKFAENIKMDPSLSRIMRVCVVYSIQKAKSSKYVIFKNNIIISVMFVIGYLPLRNEPKI